MRINCFECQHFFITWDQRNPRGCKAFGFKTKELPSAVVRRASGMECAKFTPKQATGGTSK
ncbi:uracil-DNA glycosylase [Paenisporosarcina cavernae]|uniref:Uracil-DNA glycosylase n=1 Tax=Paenisporosarcina cavernae TaxID=2320858 RepID=A0A385YQL1_9BACL|nr:uracil-DNA glycosylase [Paenisporosarcina cavernae]AYC28774.1 uracil-DNA glycosylase [Paenisporosarcina cavernae]